MAQRSAASVASCGAAARVQFDPEHAALADRAFHADFAAHQFDQPLAHHQADAGAFLGAGLLSETIERLEQLREFFRRQSFAGVLDADAYAFRAARAAVTTTVPCARLYLIALESRLMRTCFTRVRSALTKYGMSNWGKAHADAAFLRLRFDHGLAFEHDFGQRHRFQRQRQLAGLDQREIENFVDQFQQVPSRLENLVDAALLGDGWRRRAGLHELGKTEDRVERRAQLMAHAGEKFRFREVGFFRHGPGAFQLGILVLQRLARRLLASPVTSRNTSTAPTTWPSRSRIGAQLSAICALAAIACNQHRCGWPGPVSCHAPGFPCTGIADGLAGFLVDDVKNLVHRAARGFRLRPAGELFGKGIQQRHTPFGIGGYHGIADGVERNREPFLADLQGDVGLLQLFIRLLLNLEQMLSLCFDLLARGIVGADQQIADDCILGIAQRRDRHDRREAAAVLADISQLVNVLDAARGLEHQGLKPGRNRGAKFEA